MLDLTETVAAMAKKQGITEVEAVKQLVKTLIIKAIETDEPQYIEFTYPKGTDRSLRQ